MACQHQDLSADYLEVSGSQGSFFECPHDNNDFLCLGDLNWCPPFLETTICGYRNSFPSLLRGGGDNGEECKLGMPVAHNAFLWMERG